MNLLFRTNILAPVGAAAWRRGAGDHAEIVMRAVPGSPGRAAPERMFRFGMPQFGWFRTLNASSRNCSV